MSDIGLSAAERYRRAVEVDCQVRDSNALIVIEMYGGIDGAHHKQWVIDQVVRALTGGRYEEWVAEMKNGEDGPETYEWDEGIAP